MARVHLVAFVRISVHQIGQIFSVIYFHMDESFLFVVVVLVLLGFFFFLVLIVVVPYFLL